MRWTVGSFPYRKGTKARIQNVEFAPIPKEQQWSSVAAQPAQLLAIMVEGGECGVSASEQHGGCLIEAVIGCATSACTLAQIVECALLKGVLTATSEERKAGGGGTSSERHHLETLETGLKGCLSKVKELMEADIICMQQDAPRLEVYDITVWGLAFAATFFVSLSRVVGHFTHPWHL